MSAPVLITPTGTPRDQLRVKGYGRWPNKSEQLKAIEAAKKGGRK
jgi:hypothetical protein